MYKLDVLLQLVVEIFLCIDDVLSSQIISEEQRTRKKVREREREVSEGY